MSRGTCLSTHLLCSHFVVHKKIIFGLKLIYFPSNIDVFLIYTKEFVHILLGSDVEI